MKRLVLLLPLCLGAAPRPGDVFREYTWKPAGTAHVLTQKQAPVEFAQAFDLAQAVRAEVALELGNAHLGFADFHIRVNGGAWRRIPFPELAPAQPSPSRWFFQWQPVVAVPLAELSAGAPNRFELRVPYKTYEGTVPHPAHTMIYSVTFRVYYNPAKKPHAAGAVTSPAAGARLGSRVRLAVKTAASARQIDYIGHYEDVNAAGDGVYEQWQAVTDHGRLSRHLGSAAAPGEPVEWDTTWVPDQQHPIRIAARVTDDRGVVFMTKAVGGLTLERPEISVELAKPFDVPVGFTSCQYGAYITKGPKSEKFTLHGAPEKIEAARFAMSAWNAPSNHGFFVNGQQLEGVRLEGFAGTHHLFEVPLNPVSVLRSGENTFATIPGPGRSSDIHWPGVAILVRYRK